MGVEKGKLAQKLFYLLFTGNFTKNVILGGGVVDMAIDKNIDWKTPKPPKKNPSKNEFLWFVLSQKFVIFFWNFGLHVDRTLSVKFTVQKFTSHGMCH